jgi:serine/threonine-protein kinase
VREIQPRMSLRSRRRPRTQPPGTAVGPYRLCVRLALGGFCQVELAQRDRPRGRPSLVVLKRLLPAFADDPRQRASFEEEARLAQRFRHPSLLRVFDVGSAEGAPYMVTEYVAGRNLQRVLRRVRASGAPMPPMVAATIAERIARALQHAHESRDDQGQWLRLVHRDVSPENVLIGFDGRVKLIDFGIAQAESRRHRTRTGFIKGKPRYMSPEQIRGLPLDPRSDLFSLGTCLYEMLTGVCPFAAPDAPTTAKLVRRAEIIAPEGPAAPALSSRLGDVVRRALRVDATERFVSARAMADALVDYRNRTAEVGSPHPLGRELVARFMESHFSADRQAEAERDLALLSGPAPLPPEPPVPQVG